MVGAAVWEFPPLRLGGGLEIIPGGVLRCPRCRRSHNVVGQCLMRMRVGADTVQTIGPKPRAGSRQLYIEYVPSCEGVEGRGLKSWAWSHARNCCIYTELSSCESGAGSG